MYSNTSNIFSKIANNTDISYFKLPIWLFKSGVFSTISHAAFRVYSRIMYSVDYDNSCSLSQAQIAEYCGMTRSTVLGKVKELEDNGLIKVHKRTTSHGKQKSTYTVCTPEETTNQQVKDYISQLTDRAKTEINFRICRVLFQSGLFTSLGKHHGIWKVYCYLLSRADNNGYAFPGYELMAKDCGLSKGSIAAAIKALETIGLVDITKIKHGHSRNSNSYYVWPLKREKVTSQSKRHTSKSLNTEHPKEQKSDIQKRKKQTSPDVQKIDSNYITNINNTNSTKERDDFSDEKIERLIDKFYSNNPKRMRQQRDTVRKWLLEMIEKHTYKTVVNTIIKNPDIFATSLLTNIMETQYELKERRKTTAKKPLILQPEPAPKPEMTTEEQIASKEKLLTKLEKQLENNPAHICFLKKDIRKVQNDIAKLKAG